MRLKYLLFFIPIFLASVVFAQPIPLKWEFYTGADGSKIPIYGIQLIYSVTVPSPNPGSLPVNLTLPNSIINRLYNLCIQYDNYTFTNYGRCYIIYPTYKVVRKVYDQTTGTYSYPETWGSSIKTFIVSYSSNNIPNTYTVWVDTSSMSDNETFYIVLYFYNPIFIPAREFYNNYLSMINCPSDPACVYYRDSYIGHDVLGSKDDVVINSGAVYRKSVYINLSNVNDLSWYVILTSGVGIVFDLYNPSDGSVKLIGLSAGVNTGRFPGNVVWYSARQGYMYDINGIIRLLGIDLSKYSVLRYIYIGGGGTYYQIVKLPR